MKLGKPETQQQPEQLKVGDNMLVRDHTSKAFQPKYKDFCIVGLLGKNQIEIKDNHEHNQSALHRCKKDPHDRENLPTVQRRTSGKS